MSLYELKPWFRMQLSTITHRLWKKGITPNQVTITATVLSILYGISMFYLPFLFFLFPLFVLFRMALNAIDGLMASTYNMKSKTGFYLNEGGDIISDFFLFIPFFMFVNPVFMSAFIICAILTELVGVAGLYISRERFYHGPLGKSDRVFVLSVLSLIVYFFQSIPYSNVIFTILTIMLIKTIFNRLKANNV